MHRLRLGQIELKEAEAEAERLGLPPLRPVVDPADYDPLQEPFWTLPMAFAWIMSGDLSEVQNQWDEYRKARDSQAHFDFLADTKHSAGRRRLKLLVAGPHTIKFMEKKLSRDNRLLMSFEVAKYDLLKKLKTGQLVATAIPECSGPRHEVPRYVWADLDIYTPRVLDESALFRIRRVFVARERSTGGTKEGLGNILLSQEDVVRAWPPVSEETPPAEGRRFATANKVVECTGWLVDLRQAGPQDKSKADYEREAIDRFGVGPDQFRTAWRTAALQVPNLAWGNPGRPPRRTHESKSDG